MNPKGSAFWRRATGKRRSKAQAGLLATAITAVSLETTLTTDYQPNGTWLSLQCAEKGCGLLMMFASPNKGWNHPIHRDELVVRNCAACGSENLVVVV